MWKFLLLNSQNGICSSDMNGTQCAFISQFLFVYFTFYSYNFMIFFLICLIKLIFCVVLHWNDVLLKKISYLLFMMTNNRNSRIAHHHWTSIECDFYDHLRHTNNFYNANFIGFSWFWQKITSVIDIFQSNSNKSII